MNLKLSGLMGMIAAAALQTSWAWTSYQFDLPSQAPEAKWRDYLSEELGARHEVRVEGGRIDVMTDTEVIELDWPHKWHEGLGQSLHYSRATERQGVLAIIAYAQGEENLQANSRRRLELIESHCVANGIKMVVLFPNRPEEFARGGGSAEGDVGKD